MRLFITTRPLPPLCGMVFEPQYMSLKMTHLTIASQEWQELYIDVEDCIVEGSLRFLPSRCKKIYVSCPEHPTLHQLHLLIELYPELDGRLRKAYMKGDSVYAVLPEMWEHGAETRWLNV